jgi:ribonuclease E
MGGRVVPARRRALDDAISEIEKGNKEPSPEWKVRYALMLGLERVLSEKPPHLSSGLELRRHQVDALAGMLTELIAFNQRQVEGAFANGHLPDEAELEEEEEEENGFGEVHPDEVEDLPELTPEQDPGAVRRFRFRHPTASGKTIAAAGFVEAVG